MHVPYELREYVRLGAEALGRVLARLRPNVTARTIGPTGQFNCPLCRVPIGELGTAGQFQTVCARCRYAFSVLTGTLHLARSAPHVTDLRTTEPFAVQPGKYELHLALPDESRRVWHSALGLHSWIASRVGHSLSVVSTLRGDSIEELLAVEDHTTSDAIQLATPGQEPT